MYINLLHSGITCGVYELLLRVITGWSEIPLILTYTHSLNWLTLSEKAFCIPPLMMSCHLTFELILSRKIAISIGPIFLSLLGICTSVLASIMLAMFLIALLMCPSILQLAPMKPPIYLVVLLYLFSVSVGLKDKMGLHTHKTTQTRQKHKTSTKEPPSILVA